MNLDLTAAGVYKITLYENKGIVYTYTDISNKFEIGSISSTGQTFEVEFCQNPTHERIFTKSNNFQTIYKDTFSFVVRNFDTTAIQEIESIKNSRFGFVAKVEYITGHILVFRDPVFADDVSKNENSNVEVITLKYNVASNKSVYVFNSNPIIYSVTFDSDITTFDITFLTFDKTA